MKESFIHTTPIGCLATSDNEGNVSNATMFFVLKNNKFYLIAHKNSLKLKHINNNPNVCFVVSDNITYEQIQLYAKAAIIEEPSTEIINELVRVIDRHSLKNDKWIPYMEEEHLKLDQSDEVVVIELTPKKHKLFNSDEGAVEQQTSGF